MSFALIVCSGIVSSLPRDRRINCKPDDKEFAFIPLGAESALLKHPSTLTAIW